MDDMSVEELRAMLEAKDEMLRQLEAKLKEMKSDSESAINKAAEEDDEDKRKLAEDDDEDKRKLAEDDDEKKKMTEYKRMSEQASPALLSEVQALRECVATLKAERDAMQRDQAVNALLSEGRIAPADAEVAGKAFELRDLQPEFWRHFSERTAVAVPLNVIGHGASGQEVNQSTLLARIKQVAAEKSIHLDEAMSIVAAENPTQWNKGSGF